MQRYIKRSLFLCLLLLPGITGARVAVAGDSSSIFKVKRCAPFGPKSEYYQVIADLGDFQPPIVQIRSATSDGHGHMLSMQERAEKIKERLDNFQKSNPKWFKNLKAQTLGAEIVIAPGTASNYIATADAKSVTPMNCRSRKELATKLIVMIQKALTVVVQTGAGRSEAIVGASTPENLVLQGDSLMEKDPDKAAAKYKEATDQTHGEYVYADLCLVRYYIDHNATKDARAYLEKAQAQKLTPEQQAQVQELQKELP